MSETYLATYEVDGKRYSIYLNAKSPDDAKKEILSRYSKARVENVKQTGRRASAR